MSIHELDPVTLYGCQQGDTKALGVLYDCYRQPLYYLARRMVGAQEAEDVCHEIFIAVFRSLPKFRGKSKLSTWILSIGTHLCLMHLRQRRGPAAQTEPLESADDAPLDTLSPAYEVEARDFMRRLSAAIDTLPDTQRLAITLRGFQEMSYEQVAGMMQLSIEQVRATLFRARRNLIKRLKEGS
ncbi:MAG: sigma-70 family RNA polymerase sigma factor [Verrucomicrobia bacterium]|nr:sigma-70 family RNA polymerase sigma factor [Verrucomicrobiota bacterium]